MKINDLFINGFDSFTTDQFRQWQIDYVGGFLLEREKKIPELTWGLGQVPQEFSQLLTFLKDKPIRSFLEIGTSTGACMMILGYLLRKTLEKIDIVDIYRLDKPEYSHVLEKIQFVRGLGNISVNYYCTLSDFYFHGNTLKWDLIFVDGNHEYPFVKRDFENAVNVLNDSGYIIMHDIASKGCPGVKKMWENVKNEKCLEFIFDDRCGIGVWTR